jgi:hypothetical protein
VAQLSIDLTDRLWRVRRRHHHIDAVLRPSGPRWELQYFRNDRLLVTRRYEQPDLARADATARLNELQRAGWNTHW